jgi:two-component system response regulator YesN
MSAALREKIEALRESDEKSGFKSRLVYNVEKYITDNTRRSLTLAEIAEKHYISVPYLCSVFKKETKRTVATFILKAKMDDAKEMLKDRRLKLKDIAELLGYQNANYFTKVFKQSEGVTPSAYRESVAP